MGYTPNNTSVYLRAAAGFMAGITAAESLRPILAGSYTMAGEMADAYAQELDTVWGSTAPTSLELLTIAEVSEAVWSTRSPLASNVALLPSAYLQVAEAVVARVMQLNAQVVSEGINPNDPGGGGTGTVTDVTGTSPIVITGVPTVTPNVTINPATDTTAGSMSAADKLKLDGLSPGGGVSSVTGGNGIAVTGPTDTPTVELNPTGAAQSDVYVWDTGAGKFDLRQLTADDIGAGFAISSFTGGSTVETGATVTNPTFTASYTSTPTTSANITNTAGIDSPLALVSPYTTGTVVGAFTESTNTSVVFTLQAISTTTKTAASNINFFPRTFGGVGTAGATSATASGTTAVLNGGAGTLASEGLFSGIVGQSFGPFNPSTQNIYILTPHTATPHTYKDGNGFSFAMNAPVTFSFTNAQGAVLSYDLYQSTNVLGTTFTITVVT
jgi:hypothetical protein